MYKLNHVLTTSKNLIATSWRKLLTFLKKNAKNSPPTPHLAAMIIEFMAARRGEGVFLDPGQRRRLVPCPVLILIH